MKYNHILLTGGAGFIGSHLTDYLLSQKLRVRILDNLHEQIHPQGKLPAYLPKSIEFIKGDVTNRKTWMEALEGIDAVIHLAAAVGVGQSMYQIERYVRDNCLGSALLLDILANEKHKVKKIIVAGSMSSIGEGFYQCEKCGLVQQPQLRNVNDLQKGLWEPMCKNCHVSLKAIPTDETARLQSPSVYAITKKTQEDLFLSVGKAYAIPAVSLRFFNAYGPRQSLSNPYNGVAAIFLSRVKNNKPPIINEDGGQTRDFVYITDIVRAVLLSLESDAANYQIFHVGSGVPTQIKQVAEIVLDLYQSRLKPEISGKFRKFDVRHCFADTSLLKNKLGWIPEVGIVSGMKKVFEWSQTQGAIDKVDFANKELEKRGLW